MSGDLWLALQSTLSTLTTAGVEAIRVQTFRCEQ